MKVALMPNGASFEIVTATSLTSPELLRPVLESAIRHPINRQIVYEDVENVLASIPRSADDENQKYTIVAWSPDEARALGMMSLMVPDMTMQGFAKTANPAELTNAYVLSETRGAGIGRALVRVLEDHAREQGHTEILLNSGPRFRFSGWPFWRRLYGEPVTVARDYYGAGYHAPVWRKPL